MFLDTSGIFAFRYKAEREHSESVKLMLGGEGRFTHSYVISEIFALANARRCPLKPVIEFVNLLNLHPNMEVFWVDEALNRKGVDLLIARPDKGYSLCDAVSFALMRERTVFQALTTDHHFAQEGFQRLL